MHPAPLVLAGSVNASLVTFGISDGAGDLAEPDRDQDLVAFDISAGLQRAIAVGRGVVRRAVTREFDLRTVGA